MSRGADDLLLRSLTDDSAMVRGSSVDVVVVVAVVEVVFVLATRFGYHVSRGRIIQNAVCPTLSTFQTVRVLQVALRENKSGTILHL